jgi:DNA-directed RNA polymerase subunit RPC12/RpoP
MNKIDQIWRILEVLVQTNGTIQNGSKVSCMCCGHEVFVKEKKWQGHTEDCPLWRARLLLDKLWQRAESTAKLNAQAKALYREFEALKQSDPALAHWVAQIMRHWSTGERGRQEQHASCVIPNLGNQ